MRTLHWMRLEWYITRAENVERLWGTKKRERNGVQIGLGIGWEGERHCRSFTRGSSLPVLPFLGVLDEMSRYFEV